MPRIYKRDSQGHCGKVAFPETAVWHSGAEEERNKKTPGPKFSSKALSRFSYL